MPTSAGPNISGEENLVFGYDLSDQKNSYLGEPTTNLANNTPLYGGWPSSYALIDSATKTFDFTTSSVEWGGVAAWTTFYYNVSDYTGQYVTISAVVESFDETNGVFSFMWIGQTVNEETYLGYSPEQDRNTKNTKTRERISWSGVIGTGGKVGILIWMNNGSGGSSGSVKVRFSNLQVEVKSHPTPFVNGTRSTTQGLLDLTGNSTINLSSVSFDSNSQMVFDGTDDFITAGNNPYLAPGTGNFTYSCWINPVGYSYYAGLLVVAVTGGLWIGKLGSNMVLRAYNVEDHLQYSTLPTVGQWTNVVITRDGTAVTLYYNANSVATATTGYNFVQATAYIGNDGPISSANFNGKITNTSFYNRALSSSEVLNNYNNIKRKYGI
jgi:hypothetical protein